jgi:hypothetical protein
MVALWAGCRDVEAGREDKPGQAVCFLTEIALGSLSAGNTSVLGYT